MFVRYYNQALEEVGWTVTINEQDENYKIQDLSGKSSHPIATA
jgi:hypothetical protein